MANVAKTNGSGTADVNAIMSRHESLIPKDHLDHPVMISHINKLTTSGNVNEARRLHDRYITGGGAYAKDAKKSDGVLLKTYSDGTLDVIFGEDASEDLEKTVVEYLLKRGYEETLDKGLKAEHKSAKGGMTAAGVKAYRRENPGSKLQTAVGEKHPKGKRAARRRSFCARMSGAKGPMKDKHGKPTRKALALRRWRC